MTEPTRVPLCEQTLVVEVGKGAYGVCVGTELHTHAVLMVFSNLTVAAESAGRLAAFIANECDHPLSLIEGGVKLTEDNMPKETDRG